MLRLNWRSDHSDRTGHNVSFAANPLGKSHLVTGTNWNCRVGYVTTGRTIDQINSHLLQLPGKFDRLINIPPALYPIRRRDAHEQRQFLRPLGSNGRNDLAAQSGSILE